MVFTFLNTVEIPIFGRNFPFGVATGNHLVFLRYALAMSPVVMADINNAGSNCLRFFFN